MITLWHARRVLVKKGELVVGICHEHNGRIRTIRSNSRTPLEIKLFTICHEYTSEEMIILYVRNPIRDENKESEIAALKLTISQNEDAKKCAITLFTDMIGFMTSVQDPLDSLELLSETLSNIQTVM